MAQSRIRTWRPLQGGDNTTIPMNISVECMGASMRWCGSERLTLDLPEAATVSEALHKLAQRYPELASRQLKVAVAIGNEIVPQDRAIREGEIIALIPPVSGG